MENCGTSSLDVYLPERALALEDQAVLLQALGIELSCSCANEHVSSALAESLALSFPDACYFGVHRVFGTGGLLSVQNMKLEGDCQVTLLQRERTLNGVCLQNDGSAVSCSTRQDRKHAWLDLQYAREFYGVTCFLVVPVVYDPEGIVLPFLYQAAHGSAQKTYSELLETYHQLADVAQCAGSLSLGFRELRLAFDGRHFSNLILLAGSVAPSFAIGLDQVVQDLSRVCTGEGLQTRRLETGGEFALLDLALVTLEEEHAGETEEEQRKESKQSNDGCRQLQAKTRDDSEFDKPPCTLSVVDSGSQLVAEESEDSCGSSASATPCHTDEPAMAESSSAQLPLLPESCKRLAESLGKDLPEPSRREVSGPDVVTEARESAEETTKLIRTTSADSSEAGSGTVSVVGRRCRDWASEDLVPGAKSTTEAEGSHPAPDDVDNLQPKFNNPVDGQKSLTENSTALSIRQDRWLLNFLDAGVEQDYLEWRCSHLRLVDFVNNLAFVWFVQLGVRLPWHEAYDDAWLWTLAISYLLFMFLSFWCLPQVWRRNRDNFYAFAWLIDLLTMIYCGVPKAVALLPAEVMSKPRWFYYLSGMLPGCVWQLCRLVTFKKYIVLQALTLLLFLAKHHTLCSSCCALAYGECRVGTSLGIALGCGLVTSICTYLYDKGSRRAFLMAVHGQQQHE